MIPMTMEYLEKIFNRAKELDMYYVAIRVEMDGFPKAEIIINPIENVDTKLAYYKNAYDENLNHKIAKGIRIRGFAFGKDMNEIQDELDY